MYKRQGDYRLVEHLDKHGHICVSAYDIEPRDPRVDQQDALSDLHFSGPMFPVITNPPWDRKILHPMIDRFRKFGCWLLFDADWMHTKQSSDYMKFCEKVVSVGRVKWFDDTTGKDNAAWYRFVPAQTDTTFIGR